MESQLLVNKIQTPDGTILESKNRHHYVEYKDKNGEIYMIDGGTDYMRTSVNKESYKNLSVWTDSPFEEIRENLIRFTKDGEEVLLKDMSIKHLYNCILYDANPNGHIGKFRWQYIRELAYRYEKGLIED